MTGWRKGGTRLIRGGQKVQCQQKGLVLPSIEGWVEPEEGQAFPSKKVGNSTLNQNLWEKGSDSVQYCSPTDVYQTNILRAGDGKGINTDLKCPYLWSFIFYWRYDLKSPVWFPHSSKSGMILTDNAWIADHCTRDCYSQALKSNGIW